MLFDDHLCFSLGFVVCHNAALCVASAFMHFGAIYELYQIVKEYYSETPFYGLICDPVRHVYVIGLDFFRPSWSFYLSAVLFFRLLHIVSRWSMILFRPIVHKLVFLIQFFSFSWQTSARKIHVYDFLKVIEG